MNALTTYLAAPFALAGAISGGIALTSNGTPATPAAPAAIAAPAEHTAQNASADCRSRRFHTQASFRDPLAHADALSTRRRDSACPVEKNPATDPPARTFLVRDTPRGGYGAARAPSLHWARAHPLPCPSLAVIN